MIRAKFHVAEVALLPGQDAGVRVKMNAVSRGDRNANWAKATPSGSIEMTVNNPQAAAWFEELIAVSRRTGKYPELFLDMDHSTDGYPGDGHAFRMAEIPEGIYGHGTCGECGLAKDAETVEYDHGLGKTVPTGLAHPKG